MRVTKLRKLSIISAIAVLVAALTSTAYAEGASSVALGPAASAPAASGVPQKVKLSYRIYRSGLAIGVVDEEFERTGDRYRIRSNTRTDGALALLFKEELTAVSEGKIVANNLIPSAFSSIRKSDQSRNFTNRFDWSKAELIRETPGTDGERESFELPTGTQDRLTSMYQFMLSPPKADRVTTLLTQGKHPERYVYVKQDEPRLQLGGNAYATVHYARDAKAGESRAEIWLAKDSHYLPVRAIFTDNKGARLEQVLVALAVTL